MKNETTTICVLVFSAFLTGLFFWACFAYPVESLLIFSLVYIYSLFAPIFNG